MRVDMLVCNTFYAYLKVRNLSIKLSNLGVMFSNLFVKFYNCVFMYSNQAFKVFNSGIQILNGAFSRCLKSENSQEKDGSENHGWRNGLVPLSSSRDSLTCQFKPVLLFQQWKTLVVQVCNFWWSGNFLISINYFQYSCITYWDRRWWLILCTQSNSCSLLFSVVPFSRGMT